MHFFNNFYPFFVLQIQETSALRNPEALDHFARFSTKGE
jgi:hypothetical protein